MEPTRPLIPVEEQFKIMADTAPVLIWIAGVDKLCYFFNSGWLKFTGRTMEQEYGNGWAEGVHPEDMERCLKIYTTSFDARKEFKMEYRLRRYNGQYRWLLDNGVPRYTNDGEFAGYIGSCIDIDELLETQKLKGECISKEALKKEQFLNESLAAANEELAASNEEITAINEELYSSQQSLYKLNQELEGLVASRTKALSESEDNLRNVILQSQQSFELSQGELRENEQKFRLLADNISQLAWMTDETGWIFWYNQRWYDYTGTTLEEMQGWGWAKVHHPDLLDCVTEKFKQHLQSGEVWEDTFLIKSKHGEFRWFLSRAIPVRNDENRIIRWLGTNTDITDKILSEQQLAAKNKELSFLADSIPSIVWTSKPNGELDYINSRWHQREPDTEDLPLGSSWLDNLHPDDVERTQKAWKKAISTGEPYEVEFRLKGKNDKYRWFLVRALALRDEKGHIIKWYGNNTDIHEQKELQQQKDDFISIASHELKTPITSLKASIQLMERIKNKPEAKLLPKLIEQSDKSVQKISNLVEELLNVGRLNEGQLRLNKSLFNVAGLLKDCCNAIRLENKHELSIEGDIGLRIIADEHRIDQVVTNLINNAIKYAPNSKKICLSISKENNYVKISVEDNGPGIRPEKLAHLFDRYFRAEPNTAKDAGLGLGLYISAEIIKRHDGQIGVNSELGKGSTFWFTLPINASDN